MTVNVKTPFARRKIATDGNIYALPDFTTDRWTALCAPIVAKLSKITDNHRMQYSLNSEDRISYCVSEIISTFYTRLPDHLNTQNYSSEIDADAKYKALSTEASRLSSLLVQLTETTIPSAPEELIGEGNYLAWNMSQLHATINNKRQKVSSMASSFKVYENEKGGMTRVVSFTIDLKSTVVFPWHKHFVFYYPNKAAHTLAQPTIVPFQSTYHLDEGDSITAEVEPVSCPNGEVTSAILKCTYAEGACD